MTLARPLLFLNAVENIGNDIRITTLPREEKRVMIVLLWATLLLVMSLIPVLLGLRNYNRAK